MSYYLQVNSSNDFLFTTAPDEDKGRVLKAYLELTKAFPDYDITFYETTHFSRDVNEGIVLDAKAALAEYAALTEHNYHCEAAICLAKAAGAGKVVIHMLENMASKQLTEGLTLQQCEMRDRLANKYRDLLKAVVAKQLPPTSKGHHV